MDWIGLGRQKWTHVQLCDTMHLGCTQSAVCKKSAASRFGITGSGVTHTHSHSLERRWKGAQATISSSEPCSRWDVGGRDINHSPNVITITLYSRRRLLLCIRTDCVLILRRSWGDRLADGAPVFLIFVDIARRPNPIRIRYCYCCCC